MSKNAMRSILYSLNEGNANNPANLLVGEDITVNHYKNGEVDESWLGSVESITNREVIVTRRHTDESYDFLFNGFNAHENGIEFVNDQDDDLRFYIY